MTQATTQDAQELVSNRVVESAEKLQRHIRASGLRPGDKYLTAADAGQLLGESVTTAQRAMALLAQRRILERRPRAGTFIGTAVAAREAVTCIHFLIPEQCLRDVTVSQVVWKHVEGMREVLPNLAVQLNFVPHQDVAFAKQVVERAGNSLAGVVLLLSSRPMRAYFNQSGIPTVVGGGVEPDLVNLCWLNWDQMQTGRLLAGHLIGRGHRRFATVMREVWSVGEHQLHDGIAETMAGMGVAANAMLVRSAPVDKEGVIELARGLLREPNPITGFICRTEFQADCVVEAAKERGLADSIEVTVANVPVASNDLRYTCSVSELNLVEMGKIIGGMFKALASNTEPSERGRILPVRLQEVR